MHASVGLGIGLVAGPALIAVDPGFLPGPVIMATLVLTARHLVVDGPHADRGTVTRAYVGVPFGPVLGLVVVAVADEATMRLVVGCAIVVAAGLLLLGVHVSRRPRSDVLGGGAFSLGLLAVAGEFGSHELELTAWMIPGVLIGLLAGRHVRPHLDNAWFRPAVLWLALLGGAAVVIRQVA